MCVFLPQAPSRSVRLSRSALSTRSLRSPCRPSSQVKETPFSHHWILKTIVLPRQARDKHRENSKRNCVFLGRGPTAAAHAAAAAEPAPGVGGTAVQDGVLEEGEGGEEEVRQRRGRWCFGNLNSVAGRLHAHYLFLACTPFLYPVGSGQEYHVDAVQKRPFPGAILC